MYMYMHYSKEVSANSSFADNLRTILRQDPDVIMVGEIRDQETAVNSIRLAQTGHLVLTTIHSSDGLGVINKLLKTLKIL